MDEQFAVELFAIVAQLACALLVAVGTIALPIGYILWEKRKKTAKSKGREAIGIPLGLHGVDAEGGQDRLGGNRGDNRWVVGWEVRKVVGKTPKFVTFLECYPPAMPTVELRYNPPQGNVSLSGQVGEQLPLDHPDLDAAFLASGDAAAIGQLANAGAYILPLRDLCDDFYILPDRLVMICVGDQNEPEYLRERLEAIEKLVEHL